MTGAGTGFIYDTDDVRNCRNRCEQCQLYQLLNNEQGGTFTARLKKASEADKRLFGPQNFLNCKTIAQYQRCYSSFICTQIKTKKELQRELTLLRGMKIVFTRGNNNRALERQFKRAVLASFSGGFKN